MQNICKNITVLHVISSLERGGAETVMASLVSNSAADFQHIVVSLQDSGLLGEKLRSKGVEVVELHMERGKLSLSAIIKLFSLVRKIKPTIVQTWMYHSDLLGGIVSYLAGVRTVVWGIHSSNLGRDVISFSARASACLSARVSLWIPRTIVCCSERAALVHQKMGYQADKFVIIPNGCDLSWFVPDSDARNRIRAEWGVASSEILLGMVARWDPQKDHVNLLGALSLLMKEGIDFRCVLIGNGMSSDNVALVSEIDRVHLSRHIILAGLRDDIPSVMNGLDLHVLSSVGEAFPIAVAEAMACSTPCVVTDVGDAALIVGDTGWVVPPQNAVKLADGIKQGLAALKENERAGLGRACRERIAECFSNKKMVDAYQQVWRNLAGVK